MLIDKSSSKSLHTYTEIKLHPRANKFQSKTYQAKPPTIQEHNSINRNHKLLTYRKTTPNTAI